MAARCRPGCLRLRGRRSPCDVASASPRGQARRASPQPRWARAPPVTGSCPRRPESRARMQGTRSPRVRRRTAQAPPAPGLRLPPFREEVRNPRTRGAFPRSTAPEGRPPAYSTSCHQPVEYLGAVPFLSSRDPSALTGQGFAATRSRRFPAEAGPAPSQHPSRFLRSGQSAARCAAELPGTKLPRFAPPRNRKIMRPSRNRLSTGLSTDCLPEPPRPLADYAVFGHLLTILVDSPP